MDLVSADKIHHQGWVCRDGETYVFPKLNFAIPRLYSSETISTESPSRRS